MIHAARKPGLEPTSGVTVIGEMYGTIKPA